MVYDSIIHTLYSSNINGHSSTAIKTKENKHQFEQAQQKNIEIWNWCTIVSKITPSDFT